MQIDRSFLAPKGDYRNLIVFKKAECIYVLTYHFVHRFLKRGDRPIDQMLQAARSGKQNIIEGSAASTTSQESEIKLFNVSKASFDELLADYEDYLTTRNLSRWNEDKRSKVRDYCRSHNDATKFYEIAPSKTDETIANLCITMIRQELYLLIRLIESAKQSFINNGGIREEMSKARRNHRNQSNN